MPPATRSAERPVSDVGLYTVPDVAALQQCSEKTVWRQIAANAIPGVVRLGRLVRLHKPTVDRWLANGCPTAG